MSKRKQVIDRVQWSAIFFTLLVLIIISFTDTTFTEASGYLMALWGGVTLGSVVYTSNETKRPSVKGVE